MLYSVLFWSEEEIDCKGKYVFEDKGMVDEEGEGGQSKGDFAHLPYKLKYQYAVKIDGRGEFTSNAFNFDTLLLLNCILDCS